MSNNTVNAALRRLGYTSEEMTGHGFRSLASTCLNEQGYHPDLIELQLAHAERNKVRAAYNKAQRLPERRKMMQAWADYLEVCAPARTSSHCGARDRFIGAALPLRTSRATIRCSPSRRLLTLIDPLLPAANIGFAASNFPAGTSCRNPSPRVPLRPWLRDSSY
jgi:hypothetical protein